MADTARARKGRTRETERTENREEAAVEGKEEERGPDSFDSSEKNCAPTL